MKQVAITVMLMILSTLSMSANPGFRRFESFPESMAEIERMRKDGNYTEVTIRYMRDHLFQVQNETGSQGGAYCFIFGIYTVNDTDFIIYGFGSDHECSYYMAVWDDGSGYPPTLQIGHSSGGELYSDFIYLTSDTIIINTVKRYSEYPHFCQEIYRLDKKFTRLSDSYHDENNNDYWGRNSDDIVPTE